MERRLLRNFRLVLSTCLWLAPGFSLSAQSLSYSTDRYHTPDENAALVRGFQSAHPLAVKLHTLARGYAGGDYLLLEVGSEIGSNKKAKPAVLVVANMEGTNPLASEAALFLIRDLLGQPDRYKDLTWYILACGNQEAAWRFFRKPGYVDGRNTRPFNDDMDDRTDEDGPEDLNGDGWITEMRVKDPDGTLVPDEKDPRQMRRADPLKAERGVYKLYPEGIDNDQDGQYNEDGPGGTNLGITFPHLYGYNKPGTGLWSGSEPEVYSLMEFVNSHPEIALTMTYGSTNFCLVPPRGGRKTSTNLSSIKLPLRYVQMLNADPDKTYSLEEVKEMLKAVVPPGTTVDDAMVAGMLDMGAVVNPLEADLKVYQDLSDKYKKYLKDKGVIAKRLDPARDKDGSFELWSYYHLGLPSFSMDFWGLPELAKDTTKGGKKAEGGKEEVQRDPLLTTFLAYNDRELGGKGFIPWKEFDHPKLGKVEIGGMVPYANLVPAEEKIDSLLALQVPWIYELADQIPELKIEDVRIEPQGGGVFRVTAWVRNTKTLPYPMAMGMRNKAPAPAVMTVTGNGTAFISGKARTTLDGLNGNEQKKFTWLILAEKPADLIIRVETVNAVGDSRTINLGGK